VPELAKHYRVITLDLPGHGKSGAPKDGKVTTDMFARAVEAVRAEQKADRIILVGHSMGTPVIRQYAHLYPQHVAALVLVDGVVVAPTPAGGRGIRTPLDPDQLMTPQGLSMREGMIKGMFHAEDAGRRAGARIKDDAGRSTRYGRERDAHDVRREIRERRGHERSGGMASSPRNRSR